MFWPGNSPLGWTKQALEGIEMLEPVTNRS
jgi:hypothetical protein